MKLVRLIGDFGPRRGLSLDTNGEKIDKSRIAVDEAGGRVLVPPFGSSSQTPVDVALADSSEDLSCNLSSKA
jgi:hypothetical protein